MSDTSLYIFSLLAKISFPPTLISFVLNKKCPQLRIFSIYYSSLQPRHSHNIELVLLTRDLIADQLMFVPPQREGEAEGEPGDADAPLKTILVWGGLAQWGKVRGGR